MLCEQVHTFEQHDITSVVCQGKPYFRATDITMILEYKNSAKAIRMHVSDKYTKTLQELHEVASSTIKTNVPNWNIHQKRSGKSPLYLNEPFSEPHSLWFSTLKY